MAASHPAVAGNPAVPQPHSSSIHPLLPVVTSYSPTIFCGTAYRAGLRKPMAFFPLAIRKSLTKAMTDAKMGEEADVPSIRNNAGVMSVPFGTVTPVSAV